MFVKEVEDTPPRSPVRIVAESSQSREPGAVVNGPKQPARGPTLEQRHQFCVDKGLAPKCRAHPPVLREPCSDEEAKHIELKRKFALVVQAAEFEKEERVNELNRTHDALSWALEQEMKLPHPPLTPPTRAHVRQCWAERSAEMMLARDFSGSHSRPGVAPVASSAEVRAQLSVASFASRAPVRTVHNTNAI